MVINYIDKDQTVKDLYWTVTKMGNDNGNNLLEANEKFEVTVADLSAALMLTSSSASTRPSTLRWWPRPAPCLTVERTMPAYIDTIMNLH